MLTFATVHPAGAVPAEQAVHAVKRSWMCQAIIILPKAAWIATHVSACLQSPVPSLLHTKVVWDQLCHKCPPTHMEETPAATPRNPFLRCFRASWCLTVTNLQCKSQHRGCEALIMLRYAFDGISWGERSPMWLKSSCAGHNPKKQTRACKRHRNDKQN